MYGRLRSLTEIVPVTGDGEAGIDKSLTENDNEHTGSEERISEHRDMNNTMLRTTNTRRAKYLSEREEKNVMDITGLFRNGPEIMEHMANVSETSKDIGLTCITTK